MRTYEQTIDLNYVLNALYADLPYSIMDGYDTLIWKSNKVKKPSKEFLEGEIKRLEKEQKVQEVQEKLMVLCDSKQDEAGRIILGYKGTPKQIERYKDKYERALLEEFNEAENMIIIQKYSEYIEMMNTYVDLIELFRGKVGDLIKVDNITEASKLVNEGNVW